MAPAMRPGPVACPPGRGVGATPGVVNLGRAKWAPSTMSVRRAVVDNRRCGFVYLAHALDLIAIEGEHKEPNGRRQISVIAPGIDRREQSRQSQMPARRNLLQ